MNNTKFGTPLSVKSVCFIALFTAVICVLSFVTIPLPFTSVPLTLGLLGIFITALVLRPRDAVIAVAAYIALGAIDLPVFSSFRGGIEPLFSYTGGFIWGYIPLTLACALFANRFKRHFAGKKLSLIRFVGAILGLSLCYICGMLQFAAVTQTGIKEAVLAAVVPFIGFDILKAVLAVILAGRLKER